MKLHRFYVKNTELIHKFWLRDAHLFHQWTKVLRFQIGREVSLFNEERVEKLYRIVEIGSDAIHLELMTELVPKVPAKDVYLCFSLLKKDKNDWVLQKATELGVSHFVPLLCERTEKTGFDEERALRIVTEAAEQCGRVDIPKINEPTTPEKMIEHLTGRATIFIAEQGSPALNLNPLPQNAAILIGPEGGWTDQEKQLFKNKKVENLGLSNFTLRAETAAVTAAAMIVGG